MKKVRNWFKRNTKKFVALDAALLIAALVVVFGPAKPEEVDGLTIASSTFETAEIKWDQADNAKTYRIYRSEDGDNYEFLAATNDTSYSDTGLTTGKTYYYSVTSGNGLKSTDVDTAEKAAVVPELEQPELDIDTTDGEIKLSISEVDGAAGYEIIRNGEVIDQSDETTYVDEEAAGDEQYEYEVKAYRYEEDPVYSDSSESKEAILHAVGKIGVEVRGDDLIVSWGKNDHYSKYKVYSGDDEIYETNDDRCQISDFETNKEYDLKVVGYNEDESVQSPDTIKNFQVVEEEMTNEDAIDAAVDWGISIANDDSFTYGTGKRSHRYGCYFCQTNVGPRKNIKGKSLVNGHSYARTYCCNPFVHACYSHGAGDPAMLRACQAGKGIAMTVKSFTRYGNWEYCGKVRAGDLKKGDVLVRSDHVMMYIGNGKIVHAAGGGWDAGSIKVKNLGGSRYSFVMRYTGNGSGVKKVVRNVDENGNLLDDEGNIIEKTEDKESDSASEEA